MNIIWSYYSTNYFNLKTFTNHLVIKQITNGWGLQVVVLETFFYLNTFFTYLYLSTKLFWDTQYKFNTTIYYIIFSGFCNARLVICVTMICSIVTGMLKVSVVEHKLYKYCKTLLLRGSLVHWSQPLVWVYIIMQTWKA